MTTFVIGTDNNITASSAREQVQELGGQTFVSEKDLGKLAAEWPAGRCGALSVCEKHHLPRT